jgi:phosphatidylethanolamine/phosphatidyl-N-methylethanolamine N-methyltransferase
MRFWVECGDFLRESRRHFRDTGAVLPSSRFLGQALVAELKKRRGPSRILEVGPGTGSVTAQILRYLIPGDQLDVVELNEHFIDLLKRRFASEWRFWQCRDQVRLIHSRIENVSGEGVYDYIISALPLNNLRVDQVRDIFRTYARLLKPGGMLTYFEYVWIRHLKTPFAGRRERRRLYRVGRVVTNFVRAHQVKRERVFMNVPPAVVRHLKLDTIAVSASKPRKTVRGFLRHSIPAPTHTVARSVGSG